MNTLSACPVCGSDAIAHAFTGRTTRNAADPARWDVWHCAACDHGFINPQPTWDDLAPYYNAGYTSYRTDYGMPGAFDATVEESRQSGRYRHVPIREGMRVLDVGCGGGSFLRVARALGADVYGIEPSPHAVERVRAEGIDVFHGMIDDYVARHGNERFDLITFSHVIEHTPDPAAVLRDAGSLLAPGGYVWMAVPNAGCRSAASLGWRWHSTDLPLHLMQFTATSVRAAAERAGLSVRRVYTYSLPSAVRASMIADLRHRLLIPRRIGRWLVSDGQAAKRGAALDARDAGEAILAELTL